MARKTTPSFILELPLVSTPKNERQALVRLECGRRLFNACLGEALRRLDLMRQSKAWQAARALPAGEPKSAKSKARAAAFKLVNEAHSFSSASISAFGTKCKNEAHWQKHLGAHETQRIAERTFQAAQEYSFGTRGRPRFKGKGRPLHSMEGKSAGSGLKWKREIGCLEWSGMILPALLPSSDQDKGGYVAEALDHRTKYARIIWRTIAGQRRWFVQLVQEGLAPRKYQTIPGAIVGMDVGPSVVAVYSDEAAALIPLCPEVNQPWAEMRRAQRAMDRSRRTTNPECYNANGTFKKGAKIKVRSTGYQELRSHLAETERVLEQRRKHSHGRLVNQILGLGNVVQTEKLSYKAFQKMFGRSSKVRALGALMAQIQRKAESAGGEFVDLNTWRLKLSQYDHLSNTYTKKKLSERWHVLGGAAAKESGSYPHGVIQRDLYSAFLAANAAKDAIHSCQVETTWPAAQSLLARAGWMKNQPSSIESLLKIAPALPAPEKVARERKPNVGHARNAVAERRESASPNGC
jgi:hypothetical protein